MMLFCFFRARFRVGYWKNKFCSLENSWKIPGILLSSVSEHHLQRLFACLISLFCAKAIVAGMNRSYKLHIGPFCNF